MNYWQKMSRLPLVFEFESIHVVFYAVWEEKFDPKVCGFPGDQKSLDKLHDD